MKNKLLSLLVFCTMMGCNSKDANQSQKVANNAASQAQDYPTTIPESNPASAPTTNDNKNSINTFNPQEYKPSPNDSKHVGNYLRNIALYAVSDIANPAQLYNTYILEDNYEVSVRWDETTKQFSSYEAKDAYEANLSAIKQAILDGEKNHKIMIKMDVPDPLTHNPNDPTIYASNDEGTVQFRHNVGSDFFRFLDANSDYKPIGRNIALYARPFQNLSVSYGFKYYNSPEQQLYIDGIYVANESEARELANLVDKSKISYRGKIYIEFTKVDDKTPKLLDEFNNYQSFRDIPFQFRAADIEFFNTDTGKAITNTVRIFPSINEEVMPNDRFKFIPQP